MSELRALLLTDVVNSTEMTERLGDGAMAEVWAAHDRCARDLLPPWRGREIDKTDGMLLMFESAQCAVQYAAAYHEAIGRLPVPLLARAGLHVGSVILRENTAEDVARGAKPLEVDGLAKPTAARVMSAAVGGQTLLSGDARAALGDALDEADWQLPSHGHWLVKGVSEPIELFEAARQGQRCIAPPDADKLFRVVRSGDAWLPVRAIANNLPVQATRFVGRLREIDDCKQQLVQSRVLTLLGMGGLGKTRLSLRVGLEVMHQFPDGVWFLDLSPITDPSLVLAEAAQVLDVRDEPNRPLLQSLVAHLKAKRTLLIFDNCEHVLQAAAALAHAVVKAAPQVRILASSREPLRIPAEQTYPILPLGVPRQGDGVDALLQSPAVCLFIDRVKAQKPAFELTEREAPAVAELVARLEGIPLALELAAARVRALSIADINKRLSDRYKLLTGGSRVLQERQQTLRALVDWSYDLLQEPEKALLNRLGVFAGGFALEAAEAVCGTEPLAADEVLDVLVSLVEKSLVMAQERDEGTRYRMLETIRDYARGKLAETDGTEPCAQRHGEYFFAMAKQVRDGLQGPDQGEWAARAEADIDNLRAAVQLALAGGIDPVISVKMAAALQGFWVLRGYVTEGRGIVRAALELPEVQAFAAAQGHALYVGAALALAQSDYADALGLLTRCLALRRTLGNPTEVAATLSTLSKVQLRAANGPGEAGPLPGHERRSWPRGNAELARASATEALELFRRQGHPVGEAISLLDLGMIAMFTEDDVAAEGWLGQALALAQRIKHLESEAECERLLSEIALERGELAHAQKRLSRSLDICAGAGDNRGHACARLGLGRLALMTGELPTAAAHLGAAVGEFQADALRAEWLECLEATAELAERKGLHSEAAALMSAVEAAWRHEHSARSRRAVLRSTALALRLKAQLPAAAAEPEGPLELRAATTLALQVCAQP